MFLDEFSASSQTRKRLIYQQSHTNTKNKHNQNQAAQLCIGCVLELLCKELRVYGKACVSMLNQDGGGSTSVFTLRMCTRFRESGHSTYQSLYWPNCAFPLLRVSYRHLGAFIRQASKPHQEKSTCPLIRFISKHRNIAAQLMKWIDLTHHQLSPAPTA